VMLHSFQRFKSLGPDEWGIEFYLELFDILSNDLLEFIKESIKGGHIYPTFNSTLITLIPKSNHPLLFSDFRPISLIYKIIAKITTSRLKPNIYI